MALLFDRNNDGHSAKKTGRRRVKCLCSTNGGAPNHWPWGASECGSRPDSSSCRPRLCPHLSPAARFSGSFSDFYRAFEKNLLGPLSATLRPSWAVLGTFLLQTSRAVLASSAADRNACKTLQSQACAEPCMHKKKNRCQQATTPTNHSIAELGT